MLWVRRALKCHHSSTYSLRMQPKDGLNLNNKELPPMTECINIHEPNYSKFLPPSFKGAQLPTSARCLACLHDESESFVPNSGLG